MTAPAAPICLPQSVSVCCGSVHGGYYQVIAFLAHLAMALHQAVRRQLRHPLQLSISRLPSFSQPQQRTPILGLKNFISVAARLGRPASRPRSTPRTFPETGFEAIEQDQLVEEETVPDSRLSFYYPVRMGETLDDRFQVVAKLGYGSCSTIWLARDLQ